MLVALALFISAAWAFVGILEAVVAEEPIVYAGIVETLVFVLCVAALYAS